MHHANRCTLEKRHRFCILSNHWDTLSFCRRRDGEMKVLLLSAVLGLLYAGLGEAQLLLVPFSGEWKTHYLAASNKDIITEGGPFHIYLRHVQFHPNDTVDIDFYVKSDGECVKKRVTGVRQEGLLYDVEYAGQNKVRILQLSLTHIVGYVHNVAEDGKETDLVGIIGKRDKISDRRYQKFKKEATDRGIPEENIVNFTDNDDCPEE
ncbi:odorant-binding protein-like [Cervus elaphus]|uniref:odorant-binding protein-like n=1 Tax=Cervus canadensis TaxID=1574408 RepID=UPI001CA3266D|nr:odorant-binding protein-like [Cervus canadensis]XP_043752951.1 odorant-binding protein-like [Cervus elaphus]